MVIEAPAKKIKGQSFLRIHHLKVNTLRLVFIMYSNSDDCDLVEGWYTLKVNNVPVVVDPANQVVADKYAKPTCFYFAQVARHGGGCSYNVYTDKPQTKFAEYDNNWDIYIQEEDQLHQTPRYWTLKLLYGNIYTIGPNPPSINVWTAPAQGGQLYLTTGTTPTAEQEFVFTPCKAPY